MDPRRSSLHSDHPPQSCVTMSSCRAAISVCTQSRNGDSPRPRVSSTVWLASMVRKWSGRPSACSQPRRRYWLRSVVRCQSSFARLSVPEPGGRRPAAGSRQARVPHNHADIHVDRRGSRSARSSSFHSPASITASATAVGISASNLVSISRVIWSACSRCRRSYRNASTGRDRTCLRSVRCGPEPLPSAWRRRRTAPRVRCRSNSAH